MSAKSKIKLKGLKLKAKIKGVTDNSGTLMTTGPGEAALDNLVLKLALSTCPVDTNTPPICDDLTSVYLKVVLANGDGELDLDLTPVLMLPAGSSVAILGVTLETPTLSCPGTNSTADITARLNGPCSSGIVRGVGGLVTE